MGATPRPTTRSRLGTRGPAVVAGLEAGFHEQHPKSFGGRLLDARSPAAVEFAAVCRNLDDPPGGPALRSLCRSRAGLLLDSHEGHSWNESHMRDRPWASVRRPHWPSFSWGRGAPFHLFRTGGAGAYGAGDSDFDDLGVCVRAGDGDGGGHGVEGQWAGAGGGRPRAADSNDLAGDGGRRACNGRRSRDERDVSALSTRALAFGWACLAGQRRRRPSHSRDAPGRCRLFHQQLLRDNGVRDLPGHHAGQCFGGQAPHPLGGNRRRGLSA